MTLGSAESILAYTEEQQPTALEYAIEWVLAGTLLFTPLAYGSNDPWSHAVFCAAVALLTILAAVNAVFLRKTRLVFTWAYVPIVLTLALVGLSLVPLPAGLVKIISPGTWEQKYELLKDLPNVQALLSKVTITYSAWVTERGVRIMACFAIVFVIVVNTYRTTGQIKRLLATIAGAGIIVTLLALAMDFTHVPGQPYQIYWDLPYISMPAVHPNAGPFIGKAQLGQYLNLTIGAMLALALVQLGEAFAGEDPSGQEVIERLGEPRLVIVYLLGAAIVAALAAMAWSGTRGALLGFGVGTIATAAAILHRRGWRAKETLAAGAVLTVILVGAASALVYFSKVDNPFTHALFSGTQRLDIVRRVPPIVKQWPVMGTGLESFQYVAPLFDENIGFRNFDFLDDHAENDYAQILSDTGILGGALFLMFLVIMAIHWYRGFRGPLPIHLASIGILFSLIAVMTHSLGDFAQRTPSIGLVTSILLGLTVPLSRIGRVADPVSEDEEPAHGRDFFPRIAGAAILLLVVGWATYRANNVRLGDQMSLLSDPNASTFDATADDPEFQAKLDAYFDEPIQWNLNALKVDPHAVQYLAWSSHFRWRKLTARRDAETTAVIWPADAAETAKQIVEEMNRARLLAPTFGRLYTIMGMAQAAQLDKAVGEANLVRGQKLLKIDAEAPFYLARIAAERGDWEESARSANLAFRMDFRYEQAVIDMYLHEFKRPELAFEAMKERPYSYMVLAQRLTDYPQWADLRTRIFQKQQEQIQAEVERTKSSGSFSALAQVLAERGDRKGAIDAYRKALLQDYGKTEWRMALARLLKEDGQAEQAYNEAEICLRINPGLQAAKDFLGVRDVPKKQDP